MDLTEEDNIPDGETQTEAEKCSFDTSTAERLNGNDRKKFTDEIWILHKHLNSLTLKESHKEILVSRHKWLCSSIIDASQEIMKSQFPNIQGFSSVDLGQPGQNRIGYDRVTCEAIQLHHTQKSHWIMSNSLGGTVTILDSLFTDVTAANKR